MHMNAEEHRTSLTVGNQKTGISVYGINEIAHRQIGQHLKIPAVYYDRMREDYPELLAQNVNGWFARNPGTPKMLRTLDGVARALLSERYRRIDNYEIASAALPIFASITGAIVESCELTDSRMYIKVVDPRTTAEVRKGDIVQAGVVITNSEVGLGSVAVSPLVYRLVCSNGMIAQDNAVRKYHVGRSNTAEDDFSIYRDETIQADDKAFLMKLEDSIRAAVSQARFSRIVDKMREATEAKLQPATVPQVVELASKEYGFSETEGKGILGHLIGGGDLSLYGLANAVTRQAQDVDSYDRSTDLEATGYKIITMAPALWRQMANL
ncbi:DUF932 domain-containing protein [uncultured Mailhella sp.]|uniref:DUF932 domain-containing protein n=1 Tax=uncultured Mailhella sp. TaxID=1981031 RepID=UPI002603C7EB|nr:DUF932 domain-containing protein [uncultured Mailhella sp.]